MSGDWIKMRSDLADDPAVFKLAAITGLDRLAVVGRLWAFWSWVDRHAVDGRVDGAASTVVDDVTRCEGFCAALASVLWITVGKDYVEIPDHERHNGESSKERALKNKRQARWRDKKSVDARVDAQPSTAPSTLPSTREEKRRSKTNTSRARTRGLNGSASAAFEAFWLVYPRKVGKGAAEKAWTKAGLDDAAPLLAALSWQTKSVQWCRDSGQYVPYPTTYLNQRRWEDSPPAAPVKRLAL